MCSSDLGGHEVKTHAATIPFFAQELADARVRTLFTSYDIAGGRHTLAVIYNTEKWKRDNPKTYAAVARAFEESMEMIGRDKRAAAELYLRAEKSRLGVDDILKMLEKEDWIVFSPTPTRIMTWADYMVKSGQITNKPAGWKDFFFENVHGRPGS